MSNSGRKISSIILFLALVAAMLGSIPGFAWCFGADGHVEIEYVASGDCGDGATGAPADLAGGSSVHFDEDHCGPCLDLYLPVRHVISGSRLNVKAPVSAAVPALHDLPSIASKTVQKVVGNLTPQPPPRIAQAVLEHRTIVLLN